MTDEQIMKALHCIMGEELPCKDCSYQTKQYNCRAFVIADTLDYINRLKAENERLKQSDISKGICTIEQHAEIHKLRDELKQVRKDTAKEILEYFNNSKLPFFVDYDELCLKYGLEVDE